jgi:hypothetical protein
MIPGQNKIVFIDVSGYPRIIRDCPVLQFENLQILYRLFWEQVIDLDSSMESNFFDLIEVDPDLLKTALSITQLLGIKDEWLGIETLAALVYCYKDESGEPHKGKIWERYFETKTISKPDAELVSFEENKYSLMAGLALTEGGLDKAISLMEKLSDDDLRGYLEKRAEFVNKQETDPNNDLEKRKRLKRLYQEKFGDIQ